MLSILRTTVSVASHPRFTSSTSGWASLLLLATSLAVASGCSEARDPTGQRAPRTPVEIAPGHIDTIVGTGERATDQVDADADGQTDPPVFALEARLDTPMDATVMQDGTLFVIDWNGHKLRSLGADGMLSFVAGTGLEGDACERGAEDGRCPGTATELNHPTDVFEDADGAIWIAAWHNSKIKRLDARQRYVVNVCGTGKRQFEGDGGPCHDEAAMDLVSFDLPSSIVVDPVGNVFIADQSNQVIRRIGQDGVVTTVAGHCPGTPGFGCPMGSGYSGDGGPASLCELNNNVGQGTGPHGKLALDSQGNLYIADTKNNVVRKVSPGSDGVIGDGDPNEELITTVAGTGEAGFAGDGGLATEAQLFEPVDVAVGPDDSLFIADTENGCVRRVAPDGTIASVAGVCGQPGDAGDGGLATQAQLLTPFGISLDSKGGLYIADGRNNRIRKVELDPEMFQ
jgi:hypothetical protein